MIVDTVTGSYFRLNSSAAKVCEILEGAADAAEASDQVARRLNLNPGSAVEEIRSLIAALSVDRAPKSSVEPTPYRQSPDGGYNLLFEGKSIFHVDAEGRQLALVGRVQSPTLTIRDFLRNIGPRIAFLRGLVVLHGAAVVDGNGALAICGASEAGKTTTARLLSKYGRKLLAEDIIVASTRESKICVFKNGERHINLWATATARAFESGETRVVATEPLIAIQDDSTVDLDTIWFMDAGRRADRDSISNRSLTPSEALLGVLSNSFIGSANWRRFLDVSRLVVRATRAYDSSVPNTLERLEDAIAHQRVNSAS